MNKMRYMNKTIRTHCNNEFIASSDHVRLGEFWHISKSENDVITRRRVGNFRMETLTCWSSPKLTPICQKSNLETFQSLQSIQETNRFIPTHKQP